MVAILVVTTILCFVLIDLAVQVVESRRQARALAYSPKGTSLAAGEETGRRKPVSVRSFKEADYRIPMGIFYHSGHAWANVLMSGHVKVGMDDFAQRSIGKLDEVELPPIGKEVKQGGKIFTVKQGKRHATFHSPVDGVICGVNSTLLENPENIKRDPYLEGWICAIKPTNLGENLKSLKVAKEAAAWLKNEITKFKEALAGMTAKLAPEYGNIQDGGEIIDGVLELLDEESWELFNRKFLAN